MKNPGRRLFNLRGFIVLTAGVAGLGLPISGLASHLHQTGPLISFSRHAWMAAHWILAILFMVSAFSHAVLNRRILLNYIRGHAAGSRFGREVVGAILLVALMLFISIGHAFH